MNLSFVILTWNSESYLEKCLGSIARALQAVPLAYEVLVLDNGSRDGTRAMLERLAAADGHIVPRYEPENLGTTRSRNKLIAAARGEYVCVLDSDVELAAGVIETLLAQLNSDSRVGIVVPRVVYPSGAWQKSFDRFPTLLDKINRFFRLRTLERAEAARVQDASSVFAVDYAISAFWLMRRTVFEVVGLLDERIFYSPEDVDFCLRVWQSGRTILYVPSVTVVHHTQEISRGFKLNRAKVAHIKGLAYYFAKHRYFLRRPKFPAAAAARPGPLQQET